MVFMMMRNIKAFRFFSTLFDCRSVNWTLDGSRSTVCLIQGFLNECVWIHKHPSVFLQELFSVRHQSNKSQRTMSCAVSVTRSASYITHIWTLGRKQMDWFLWVLVKHSHCTHTHTHTCFWVQVRQEYSRLFRHVPLGEGEEKCTHTHTLSEKLTQNEWLLLCSGVSSVPWLMLIFITWRTSDLTGFITALLHLSGEWGIILDWPSDYGIAINQMLLILFDVVYAVIFMWRIALMWDIFCTSDFCEYITMCKQNSKSTPNTIKKKQKKKQYVSELGLSND